MPDLLKADGPLSLDLTLRSGQVFHWDKQADGSWTGLVGETPVRVFERNAALQVRKEAAALAKNYFALDHPLEEIYAAFPSDPMSVEALALCRGLRIIRQPRWECLATFITSSMKQVAHIRSMSLALRKSFGRPTKYGHTYPSPAMLAAFNDVYGVEVLHAWGMTEMSPLGTVCTLKNKSAHNSHCMASAFAYLFVYDFNFN